MKLLRRKEHLEPFLPVPRVTLKDGQYLLNPTASQLKNSALDLVVAGTDHSVLMVESEAKMLAEEVMLDAVTFGRMDARVATFLLEHSDQENILTITHQEIADELGSSREVISRILGGIADKQLIQLGRGTIEIQDRAALRDFSLR